MKWRLLIVTGLMVMLTACSSSNEPREINSATDICEVCNMSISHEEYAAQLIFNNGDYEVFDDLGCLIEFMNGVDESEVGATFIKDASTNKWIDVKEASYVYSKENWTPMNYGVLAFDSKKSADEWIASNGGELLSYKQLHEFNWGVHHE